MMSLFLVRVLNINSFYEGRENAIMKRIGSFDLLQTTIPRRGKGVVI